MDFNKFDSRTRAETGAPMAILDPLTGDPIMDGDKPCRVIVRGVASPTIQAKMRERQKIELRKKATKKAANKNGATDDIEAVVLEDTHNDLCEGAAPFIVGFENMERDNKPMTLEDADWFLDLTFPEIGAVLDEDGEQIIEHGADADGTPTKTPKFELKNNTFAKQIGEFAAKQANFLGNVKTS